MFDNHLNKSRVTYFQHLRWAIVAGTRLIWAGIASIIHGVCPRLFDQVAPRIIIDIFYGHLKDHPNQDYKQIILEAEEKSKF
jgi:hypothetical protein